MTSVSSEPPTLRSVPSIGADSFSPTASSAPQRRSYSCYNCNYSFHIIPTANTSPSAPSSFRCPGCHHRHLIPYHIISLPLPPITATYAPSRISNYGAPAPSSFDYESFDESDSDDDDYDSDNSLPSLITPDSYLNTPASKSIVGSLPVKIFSPNSTAPPQSCSICMEDFMVDSRTSVTVNELPCAHFFHRDCIVEWLQRSNSCPLCRYKLPVDPIPEERIDPFTNQWDVEYDAVLVVDLARAREPTEGRRVNREERLDSESEANAAASGSDTVNDGESDNSNFDAMRDEDGDTLMTDAENVVV